MLVLVLWPLCKQRSEWVLFMCFVFRTNAWVVAVIVVVFVVAVVGGRLYRRYSDQYAWAERISTQNHIQMLDNLITQYVRDCMHASPPEGGGPVARRPACRSHSSGCCVWCRFCSRMTGASRWLFLSHYFFNILLILLLFYYYYYCLLLLLLFLSLLLVLMLLLLLFWCFTCLFAAAVAAVAAAASRITV